MGKIRVGIIGLGFIGESHIDAVRRIGSCEIVAVASTHPERAKARAEYFGIPKCYASVDELLADPEIDAVHNCTPNFMHHEINMKILASGKHLLSEKPLCTTYEEARALCELKAKFPQSAAAVNFNYRLNPLVQEMKQRREDGAIGDVRIITGSFTQDWLMYDTDYSWRLEPEVSGKSCAIADIGSHWMDIVQYITGHKIVEVMADLKTIIPIRKKPKTQGETFSKNASEEYDEVAIKNEDYGAVMFHTDKGATGVYYVTELAPGRGCCLQFEINGSKASFGWDQEQNDRMWMGFRGGENHIIVRNPNELTPQARAHTSLAFGHPEGWNDAFKGNIEAFYKYIEGGMQGEPAFATLEQAAYIVKLTEAVIKSSETKTWIKL